MAEEEWVQIPAISGQLHDRLLLLDRKALDCGGCEVGEASDAGSSITGHNSGPNS